MRDPASTDAAPLDLGALTHHPHDDIVVRSRPVIERLSVNVVEPVDLCVTHDARVFVADRRLETVFRLDPDAVHIAGSGLSGLMRVQSDFAGNVYALCGVSGEGRVVQMTSSGYVATIASFDFRPAGFHLTTPGRLVVAAYDGRVFELGEDDQPVLKATLAERIRDVAATAALGTIVLTESGRVVLLQSGDGASVMGYAPAQ
ncbi:MAG: hypothetical protein KDA96_27390, partial [Planctomycetaceae bacterium]|nr:hypothetical protein [Planctomycetaceae bacterium]